MILSPSSSTTAHSGLITYILNQLKDSTIYMIQKYIHELHVDF
jgi:hypothetical protein